MSSIVNEISLSMNLDAVADQISSVILNEVSEWSDQITQDFLKSVDFN